MPVKMKSLHLKNVLAYDKSRKQFVKRLKPLLLLLKLCGVFANEIKENRLKRCSWPYYSICVFWLSLYISYVYFILHNFFDLETIQVRTVIELIKHLIGFISLSINIIVTYMTQDGLIKFVNQLETYDYRVARVKKARKDNPWILRIATFATIVINLFLAFMITTDKSDDATFFMTFSDISSGILYMFGTLNKFILLYLLFERFKHLNSKIAPNVLFNEELSGSNTIKIVDVKNLYSKLYDAQQIFCNLYDIPFLTWFASLMIHVLVNIHVFRDKSILLACAFVCPPILQMLILCAICHYIVEEANNVIYVLMESMCTLVNSEQITMKIGTLTHFLHYRVSFEAAGFFTINLPLFLSIIAAITTYFIILI